MLQQSVIPLRMHGCCCGAQCVARGSWGLGGVRRTRPCWRVRCGSTSGGRGRSGASPRRLATAWPLSTTEMCVQHRGRMPQVVCSVAGALGTGGQHQRQHSISFAFVACKPLVRLPSLHSALYVAEPQAPVCRDWRPRRIGRKSSACRRACSMLSRLRPSQSWCAAAQYLHVCWLAALYSRSPLAVLPPLTSCTLVCAEESYRRV